MDEPVTREELQAIYDECSREQKQKVTHAAMWANVSLWTWLDSLLGVRQG
jgi:hypothetical protein